MKQIKAEKPVRVSIPTKASIVICKVTAYSSLAFGVAMALVGLYGFAVEGAGVYEEAVASHSRFAELISILISLYPLLFGVSLYFFFCWAGLLKITKQRELELEMAQVMRASANRCRE